MEIEEKVKLLMFLVSFLRYILYCYLTLRRPFVLFDGIFNSKHYSDEQRNLKVVFDQSIKRNEKLPFTFSCLCVTLQPFRKARELKFFSRPERCQ